MLIVAGIGLVANVIGLYLLRRGSHKSINVRAAFWHIIGDTMSSVGVIAAAIIIQLTGWTTRRPDTRYRYRRRHTLGGSAHC